MANAAWPAALPPAPSDPNAVTYAPLVANVVTTNMETGAPKMRRRFTAVPETLACSLVLNAAQCAALSTFVATTLQDVLPFDWKDWRTQGAATYVFRSRPQYQHIQGSRGLWTATLDLMKLP